MWPKSNQEIWTVHFRDNGDGNNLGRDAIEPTQSTGVQKQSRALWKRHRFFTNPKSIICQFILLAAAPANQSIHRNTLSKIHWILVSKHTLRRVLTNRQKSTKLTHLRFMSMRKPEYVRKLIEIEETDNENRRNSTKMNNVLRTIKRS